MPIDLAVTLVAVFISVALIMVSLTSFVLSRTAPEVKRLHAQKYAGAPGLPDSDSQPWVRTPQPLRKPAATSSRTLQRRLAAAGWDYPQAAWLYTVGQFVMAAIFALAALVILGLADGWPVAFVAAILGYMLPDFLVSKRGAERRTVIQNGLPDALDLLVVCVEAGSSLDQAIVKASEELEIALPPLAQEFGTVASEIRAGKPRLEAFQDFAKRTNLDDVRALVTMLIQTDRFGTSIAQALRTHAATLRTKRRQRAEERAGKVGVKLVFPLVLCLLPALYVVCLGPVGVKMYRALF